jgi:glucose/arabinose dehydrogenase
MKAIHHCLFAFLPIIFLMACKLVGKQIPKESNKIATSDSINVRFELITNAIRAPVELNVSNDGSNRTFITDNSGEIWIYKNDSLLSKPFLNMYDKLVKRDTNSLAGTIFSVAFHPDFATNRKFYVCYNAPTKIRGNMCKLVVSEFTASTTDPNIADASSERRIIEVEGKGIFSNGAEIAFGPDRYLYISVGDDRGGDSSYKFQAQDLSVLRGKLLRIDVNKTPYGIPADNPFVSTKNARPEIWAYGFRKLWRYSFDPLTKEIIGGDVGEDKVEEIDIVKKGANYGWPIMEGDSVFQKDGINNKSSLTAPISTYGHKLGICVIGGGFYAGTQLHELKNKYVFGDFNGSLFALSKNDDGTWTRQPINILNKPTDPFLLCGCNMDKNKEVIVMGFLNTKSGSKGAMYRLVKI